MPRQIRCAESLAMARSTIGRARLVTRTGRPGVLARGVAGGIGLTIMLSGPAAAADDAWKAGRDVPPGWVGILTGGGMSVGQAAGVHLGRGRILSAAHAFQGYELGWHAEVYQPRGIGNTVVKRRAVLKSLDARRDLAELELDVAGEVTVAQLCGSAPQADETIKL